MKKTTGLILLAVIWLTVLLCGCGAHRTRSSTIAFGKADPLKHSVDIYLIRTDGTGLKQLTGNGGRTDSPAWSPDGSKIAYHTEESGQIWLMNANGSGQTQLTQDPVGGNFPSWSGDGKQIVFSSISQKDLTSGSFQIYLINVDGSGMRRVTNGPENDFFPTFTPDGKILFLRYKSVSDIQSGGGDVFKINPDGTGLVLLTLTTSGHVAGYALSPDGRLLAIHDKDQHRIVILTVDGSQPSRTLIDTDFGYDFAQVAWSPDGKALAIGRADLIEVIGLPVHIVNADGSGLTTVPHVNDAFSFAWRP